MSLMIQYDHSPKILLNGTVNWVTDELNIIMVSSDYEHDSSYTSLNDISSWTVGTGLMLTGAVATNEHLSTNSTAFLNITQTFRYLMLYSAGVQKGPDLIDDPLIGYYDLGGDVVVTNSDYPVNFGGSGIFLLRKTVD